MSGTLQYLYSDSLSNERVPSMVARLRQTRTFQKMESRVLQNGHSAIRVYSLTGMSGLATLSEDGTPQIGINVSKAYYSGHYNPGPYDADGPGAQLFYRTLPQGEIFAHELAHHALNHLNRGFFDSFLGAITNNARAEIEAMRLTDELRSELGLPLRYDHEHILRVANGYYPFDPNSSFSKCFLAGTLIDMWPLDNDPAFQPTKNGLYNAKISLVS